MKEEDALGVFPKPSANALSVDTLPKGFPSETYVASGWESTEGGDGFGVICTTEFNTKRVAVAILRMRMDSRDEADSIVNQYKPVLGDTGMTTQVSGELTYSLWKDDANELMILEAPIKGGKCQLTLALGASPLTSALRIDVQQAFGAIRLHFQNNRANLPSPSKRIDKYP